MKGDVGELTAERCAIDREADTVEPLVLLLAANSRIHMLSSLMLTCLRR